MIIQIYSHKFSIFNTLLLCNIQLELKSMTGMVALLSKSSGNMLAYLYYFSMMKSTDMSHSSRLNAIKNTVKIATIRKNKMPQQATTNQTYIFSLFAVMNLT